MDVFSDIILGAQLIAAVVVSFYVYSARARLSRMSYACLGIGSGFSLVGSLLSVVWAFDAVPADRYGQSLALGSAVDTIARLGLSFGIVSMLFVARKSVPQAASNVSSLDKF